MKHDVIWFLVWISVILLGSVMGGIVWIKILQLPVGIYFFACAILGWYSVEIANWMVNK